MLILNGVVFHCLNVGGHTTVHRTLLKNRETRTWPLTPEVLQLVSA